MSGGCLRTAPRGSYQLTCVTCLQMSPCTPASSEQGCSKHSGCTGEQCQRSADSLRLQSYQINMRAVRVVSHARRPKRGHSRLSLAVLCTVARLDARTQVHRPRHTRPPCQPSGHRHNYQPLSPRHSWRLRVAPTQPPCQRPMRGAEWGVAHGPPLATQRGLLELTRASHRRPDDLWPDWLVISRSACGSASLRICVMCVGLSRPLVPLPRNPLIAVISASPLTRDVSASKQPNGTEGG